VQRGGADAAAGWECFVNLRHHQRGSNQPSSSVQFNNHDTMGCGQGAAAAIADEVHVE
jgi:hypothetical protein